MVPNHQPVIDFQTHPHHVRMCFFFGFFLHNPGAQIWIEILAAIEVLFPIIRLSCKASSGPKGTPSARKPMETIALNILVLITLKIEVFVDQQHLSWFRITSALVLCIMSALGHVPRSVVKNGCRIVFLASGLRFDFFLLSFLVPCALYLQQFGTRTSHFAWYCICYILAWSLCILHGICHIWRTFMVFPTFWHFTPWYSMVFLVLFPLTSLLQIRMLSSFRRKPISVSLVPENFPTSISCPDKRSPPVSSLNHLCGALAGSSGFISMEYLSPCRIKVSGPSQSHSA